MSRRAIGAMPRRARRPSRRASQARGRGRGCALATLGSLTKSGELFITGRIKDVIIVRGINHYPQDVERTVQDAHRGLRRNCGAAVSWLDEQGIERLVIVQEVERTYRHRVTSEDVIGCIREAVTTEHGIAPHAIVLIRPGTISKTTSGKIQRSLTRELWLEGKLEVLE